MLKDKTVLAFICAVVTIVFGAGKCESSEENCVENRKENCICTREYKPVCGCNGKTYGNKCEAECAGITNYVDGECGDK